MTDRAKIISQFAFFQATNDYWSLNADQRSVVISKWLEGVKSSTQNVWFYQVFPTRYETEDLSLFSDLVQTLRNTYGRKYTLSESTVNRSTDEIISIFAHE